MEMTREIMNRATLGCLSDEDLAVSIEFFTDLVNKLRLLTPTYNLALFEAQRSLSTLIVYQKARDDF